MKARIVVMAGAACACALALAGGGCSGKPANAGKPRVALVMKSLANEFFKTMEDGARAHQAKHADTYALICNGIKDEQDVARQVALVEQMIAERVDAIVIAPADSKALVPACTRALDAGITVVNIDNRFDAGVLAAKATSARCSARTTAWPLARCRRSARPGSSTRFSWSDTTTSRPYGG